MTINKEEFRISNNDAQRRYYREHAEEVKRKRRDCYQKNHDKELQYAEEYKNKNSDKVKEATRKWKLNNPEKYKVSERISNQKKYERHGTKIKQNVKEYAHKNKPIVAERRRKYRQTEHGKTMIRKDIHKRRRELGYAPLNPRFKGCAAHHIDKETVIHIPKELHEAIPHSQNNTESMRNINILAFAFLESSSY